MKTTVSILKSDLAMERIALQDSIDRERAMIAALKQASVFVKLARPYFPKSIRNADRFSLELTSAAVNSALGAK